MKKILKIFVLVLLTTIVKAQTSWDLTGNTPSSGNFLGSTNTVPLELKTTNTGTPQPINFYTNNTQRMTLSSGGLLGIGTASPKSLLDVNGTVTAKQVLISDRKTTQDLLAMIEQLQTEVNELKQQFTTAKN